MTLHVAAELLSGAAALVLLIGALLGHFFWH